MKLKVWFLETRPQFLLLSVVLVLLGTAISWREGFFNLFKFVLTMIGLLLAHASVNVLNDYFDYKSGIDLETTRTPFSGGSGTLPAGGISLNTALAFGLACAGVGLGIGLWFLWEIGWVLLPLVVAGGLAVLAYTDLLARIGIGEIAAGFGLGAGPVIGAALVQGVGWSTAAAAASVPAFFMTFNLLLLNEFPDEEADRKGGRRNLVLLFGRRGAAWVYVLAGLATPFSVLVSVACGWLPPWCPNGSL